MVCLVSIAPGSLPRSQNFKHHLLATILVLLSFIYNNKDNDWLFGCGKTSSTVNRGDPINPYKYYAKMVIKFPTGSFSISVKGCDWAVRLAWQA
jgi:hypothetical protein